MAFPNVPEGYGAVVWFVFLSLLACFVLRQVWLFKTGRRVNLPKLLLFSAAMSTHGLVFYFTAAPFLVAEALETAYHDVQYHGWMMHYQRRRFRTRHVARRWLAAAVIYGLVVGCLEVIALTNPRWSWLMIPFGMIVLWHYWVDGKIWRMREQLELREVVLPPEAATTATKVGQPRSVVPSAGDSADAAAS